MWLLNTRRAELHQFLAPESVPSPGYAILSHCWGDHEQVFQAIEDLKARCGPNGNPRDHASEKIRQFCILAERLGYEWGWVDTCCIDKTSSSDLSEAINSMFRYYSLSAVCIVFLHDVPTDCDLDKDGSEFRDSRWHKRGWTLQELIAPKKVVFFSRDWKQLSTKADKATLLEQITRIPEDVLALKKDVTEMSVAARMSWAADRKTTREEDEAYSLLGILKVDMYTSYGEGRHAFYRLQEELIKRSTDTSLFAWGQVLSMEDLRNLQDLRLPDTIALRHGHPNDSFLFAPAPSYFRTVSGVHFAPSLSIGSTGCAFDISGFLTFSNSPYGVLAHFPVAELKSQRLLVAFIACSMDGRQLGLVLKACTNADATSPNGPIYDISFPNFLGIIRLARLEENDSSGALVFEWRDIYIRTRPPAGSVIQMPGEPTSTPEGQGSAPAMSPTSPPPTGAPPLSTEGQATSTDPPPPSADATTPPPPPTSAPPPSENGDGHTSPTSEDALPPSMSTDAISPSTRPPPRTDTQRPMADGPPPPAAHAPPSERKAQSGAADAPQMTQAAPPAGQEEGRGKARRRKSRFAAWCRRSLQRVAMILGVPVTESYWGSR